MPFDTFTPRLRNVATRALAHCKSQYGGNGLKVECSIDPSISWRPTFFIKPTRFLMLAVEVADNLYPEALKGAAYDIGNFEFPIAVYQACSLELFQTDPGHTKVNLLRKHGFGIITVGEDGTTMTQQSTIALAQHISPDVLDSELKELNPALRPKLRAAFTTYQANEGQGLQQAGQIVEGLVHSLAVQAARDNIVQSGIPNRSLAEMIDALYESTDFRDYRAALGAARGFVKEFRNAASHAPKSAKQAADKIRRCRTGFLDAIAVCKKLRDVMQIKGYKMKLYVT